ncbi:hypothetical protein [Limosilactobacillus reuteri]|nr:hypothetical protein [Limosilactobacillus reuteri]
MRQGLNKFRHLELAHFQKPKKQSQMKQIGFKKDQPAKKQTGH